MDLHEDSEIQCKTRVWIGTFSALLLFLSQDNK